MLLSAVVELAPVRDVALPASLGRAAHALLLAAVRQADPALASDLHDDQPIKPFTAAFLEDGAARGLRQTLCRARATHHLRFTSLDARLSELLLERALPTLPRSIDVAGAEFLVGPILTGAVEHPWAGRNNYQELARHHLFDPAPPDRVALAFHAPTTFRSRGRHVPLPLPELVFGSLIDRWNAFAPIRLETDRAELADALLVGRYQLATRLVDLGGGKQVGFVGECEYVAPRPDSYGPRQAHLLAAYAFYAGVGHKTTMGLGRARRIGDGGTVSGRAGGHSAQGRRDASGRSRRDDPGAGPAAAGRAGGGPGQRAPDHTGDGDAAEARDRHGLPERRG